MMLFIRNKDYILAYNTLFQKALTLFLKSHHWTESSQNMKQNGYIGQILFLIGGNRFLSLFVTYTFQKSSHTPRTLLFRSQNKIYNNIYVLLNIKEGMTTSTNPLIIKRLDGKTVLVDNMIPLPNSYYRTLDGRTIAMNNFHSCTRSLDPVSFTYLYEMIHIPGGNGSSGSDALQDDQDSRSSSSTFYPASQPITIPSKTLSTKQCPNLSVTICCEESINILPVGSNASSLVQSLPKSLGNITSMGSLSLVAPPPILSRSSKTIKCSMDQCTDRIAKIIGDCRYCKLRFCAKHRLPESHQCSDISTCRQESFERNSSKLLDEKCVADKI